MNSKNLPELIQASLDGWIGARNYEVCHFWLLTKGNDDFYFVTCWYDNSINFFRFWGNEKDGYDMTKSNTFYPEGE